MTYGVITWMDASREKSSVTVQLEPIAANGSNYAAILSAFADLVAAFDGITNGEIFETAIIADRTRVSNTLPAVGEREDKYLVRFEDDVTKKVFSLEVPCRIPRTTMPYYPGTDFVDLTSTNGNVVALVTAINSSLRSPAAPANGVTLLNVEAVGRNI